VIELDKQLSILIPYFCRKRSAKNTKENKINYKTSIDEKPSNFFLTTLHGAVNDVAAR